MFGVVAKYNRIARWGFIVPDDPSLPDLFVHAKFLETDKYRRFLQPGQRVEFEFVEEDGKPQARHVRIVKPITVSRQVSPEESNGR